MDIGSGELLVVLVVAVLLFGSTRLPSLGRSLGEAMREIRHWSRDEASGDAPDRPVADPPGVEDGRG